MKKNKILLIIIVLLILVGAGCGTYFYLNNNKKTEEKEEVVKLEDDFYEYVNASTLKNAKIASDKSSWSLFDDAQDSVDDKKEKLIEEILNDPNYKNQNLDNAIELYSDYEGRNKRGISELKPYFDMIDNAKNLEEFKKVSFKIEKDLFNYAFIKVQVDTDYYDSSKNVLYIAPISLEASFEYYTDARFKSIKPMLIDYRSKILKLYGYDDKKIEDVNAKLQSFMETVQAKSISLSDVQSILDVYHKYTLDDIKSNIKNLPIVDYLKYYKIDNQDYYIFYDMEHYKALDEFYTEANLDTLKEFQKIMILENVAAMYTTEDFLKVNLELTNKMSGTNKTLDDLKKDVTDALKESLIGDDLAIKYEEKYFTAEDKKKVEDLITEIKSYYKESISNSTWMSEATKTEALKKLNTLKTHIGFEKGEDSEIFIYTSKANGGTLISNYIAQIKAIQKDYFEELDAVGDATIAFDNFEVNAYYNPIENSINFPAAFKELYDGKDNEFEMLAYAGSVIGHEISHAFDNSGSRFDEYGKVRDWWTVEDKANYEKLTKKIEEYYSKYEFGGYTIDGKKTLGENIADLGGINCIVSIAEKKNATTEDYKTLFESYAKLWAYKGNKQDIEMAHLSDTHSPAKIRVNAVLSSIDKFYEVYGIKENDGMYVKKDDRVSLW